MKLSTQNKLTKHICRLLKVNEVVYPIARTAKGNIGVSFNENDDEYTIMLDSIPLSTKSIIDDENNIELKTIITKYFFENEDIIKWPSIRPVEEEVSQEKPEKPVQKTPKNGKKPN